MANKNPLIAGLLFLIIVLAGALAVLLTKNIGAGDDAGTANVGAGPQTEAEATPMPSTVEEGTNDASSRPDPAVPKTPTNDPSARKVKFEEYLEAPIQTKAGPLNTSCENEKMIISVGGAPSGEAGYCDNDEYLMADRYHFSDGSEAYVFRSWREGKWPPHYVLRVANGAVSPLIHLGGMDGIHSFDTVDVIETSNTPHITENMPTTYCRLRINWQSGEVKVLNGGSDCLPD